MKKSRKRARWFGLTSVLVVLSIFYLPKILYKSPYMLTSNRPVHYDFYQNLEGRIHIDDFIDITQPVDISGYYVEGIDTSLLGTRKGNMVIEVGKNGVVFEFEYTVHPIE